MSYPSEDDIRWRVWRSGTRLLDELRAQLGDEAYRRQVAALRQFLCHYFASSAECRQGLGSSIRPLGGHGLSEKVLKVRWKYPGAGKSGGLRMLVLVDCEEPRAELALVKKKPPGIGDQELRHVAALKQSEER